MYDSSSVNVGNQSSRVLEAKLKTFHQELDSGLGLGEFEQYSVFAWYASFVY